MNYIIILFVIAVALGPIFWMMPSPRQKRQAKLRDYAMNKGFLLKVCDLPQSHRAKVREEDVKEGIVYRLTIKALDSKSAASKLDPANYMLCQRENSEQSDNCSELLRKTLVQLPQDVIALEYNVLWLGVYWQERGSIEDIELIKSKLELLSDDLRRSGL